MGGSDSGRFRDGEYIGGTTSLQTPSSHEKHLQYRSDNNQRLGSRRSSFHRSSISQLGSYVPAMQEILRLTAVFDWQERIVLL